MRLLAFLLLFLPLGAAAQPPALLDSYGRMITLLDYMTGHVGEVLLACAARNAITEAQAESRYQAWRARNAALLEAAERWREAAEKKLQAQGEERAAQRTADESGMTAIAAASIRAQEEIGKAQDPKAACDVRLAAMEAGRYDLSANAELANLLKAAP
jgi:hypothetical protein